MGREKAQAATAADREALVQSMRLARARGYGEQLDGMLVSSSSIKEERYGRTASGCGCYLPRIQLSAGRKS
jgi:hypothetical protein